MIHSSRSLFRSFSSLALFSSLLLLSGALWPLRAEAQIDVWIDPGHGGTDPGNIGVGGTQEKVVTRQTAGQIANVLLIGGYLALLTHSGDTYPTLDQRAAIANGDAPNDDNTQEECQLFISVHMNSPKLGAADTAPFGTETYFSPRKPKLRKKDAFKQDSTIARIIHNDMMTGAAAAFMGCNRDRGIKPARHVVTKLCERPAVVLEVAFLTNPCQRNAIVQAGKQTLVAYGIYAGVSHSISPGGGLLPGVLSPSDDAATTGMLIPDHTRFVQAAWPSGVEQVLSFSEGFDGATFPPTGWTLTTAGPPAQYQWQRTSDPIFVLSGSGSALVGGASPGAVNEWLISPGMRLGLNDHGLRFLWSGNRNFAASVNHECLVRVAGSGTWTQVWSLANEPPGGEFDDRERVVDLTTWLGDSIEVAFHAAGTNGADFTVDDVAVGDFAPTTAPPNDFCVNAIQLPAGSFTYSGTTCYAANDVDPSDPGGTSCAVEPLGAPDVFYQFTAQAGDTIEAEVVSEHFPVAYILTSCDTSIATCLASSSALQTAAGDTAFVQHQFASSGTYYLVVDALSGDCGSFQLRGFLRGQVTGVPGLLADPRRIVTAAPNPFRHGVRLVGSLSEPRSGLATVDVFDAAGRRAYSRSLPVVDGRVDYYWSGASETGAVMPAGKYVVRFRLGSATANTGVVLVR